MVGPLLFGILVALGVVVTFGAIWHFANKQDEVEERLDQYGRKSAFAQLSELEPEPSARRRINRLLAGLGLGPSQAELLSQADLPLTAAEFTMIVIGAGALGLIFGAFRFHLAVGLALGAFAAYLPIFYARYRRKQRQKAFTEQVPQLLTLLVGALRSGYGLTQSIELVIDQIGDPASTELERVMRTVDLGFPIHQALRQMADRIGTDEADMVVTAINVQYETGGNLAQTLEIIGETVRDRLRIQREIRVLTAQQRITGYILAALPLGLVALLFMINPDYMARLFEPGWIRLLPVAALLMQTAGFLVIRRIVDIQV